MKPYPQVSLLAVAALMTFHVFAQNPPPTERDGQRPPAGERNHEDHGGPGGRGGGPRVNPLFLALDTDKNGELSAAEIANAPTALKTLDKNQDGKLSQEEIRPNFPEGGRGGPRGASNTEAIERIMAFDKNSDGKLSSDELPERMRNLMERADANKDGFLTKEELTQAMNFTQRPAGGPGASGGPAGDRRPPQGQP